MRETVTAGEIEITRIYDAPRELVWRAWTEPERLSRWWGKRGWSTPLASITMDVRPGGAFRLTSVRDQDGQEMTQDATYREVVPPERLVFTQDARADGRAFAHGTVTFSDLGGGRTAMRFRMTTHASDAIREAAANGLASAFDRLGEHLAGPRPTTNQGARP